MTELNFFSPAQIAEKMSAAGQKKVGIPTGKFFTLAILAAELSIMVGHQTDLGVGITKLLAGSVFSVGLMLVIIAGSELFTGDNLIVIAALERKIRWSQVLNRWMLVYLGNFVGSVLLAGIMFGTGLWLTNGGLVGATALNIANAKVNLTFMQALMRGLLWRLLLQGLSIV